MADDKGGGGGSKWEPFEIIIVVILIGGLLMRLDGSATTATTSTTPPKPAVITTPTPHEACGLTTSRPYAAEKVAGFVTVSGTVTGCNWIPTTTVALYAQVIDGAGRPVSAYTAVPAGAVVGTSTQFFATVPLVNAPTKGTGYLILVPATVPSNGHTVTARIPVTFSP